MSLRYRIYQLLDHRHPGMASRTVDISIMLLIFLNVLAVILESVDEYYLTYQSWFDGFEALSVFAFTIEYLLRVWCCVENPRFQDPVRGRVRYMLTPMAIIDLLAFLPFYSTYFFNLDGRFLRVLRLVRMFKLTRYSSALDLLFAVIQREASAFISAIFVMVIIIIIASSGIYLLEHETQPEAFSSIPKAIWWATVTLTTVGYGDVVPMTPLGKAFGVLITIAGVGMAAMPAGILASGFSMEIQKRRELYRLKLREALADGVISRAEYEALKLSQQELGLEEEEAEAIMDCEKIMFRKTGEYPSRCPHCGESLVAGQNDSIHADS